LVAAEAIGTAAAARRRAAHPAPAPPEWPVGNGRPLSKLLDRDCELERLDVVLRSAEQGCGGAVLIEGEAGIGKSTLLDAAGAMARGRGLNVLCARGGELETGFGYGLMRQLLEREVSCASPARRRRLLAGAAALASPVIAPIPQTAADPGLVPPEPFALQHGIYWLLSNLAEERPLALLLDDVHWADAATLRFLVYLARRIEGMSLAVLGAVRLGEQGASAAPLQLLRDEPLVQSVEPSPLSEESVRLIAIDALAQPVDAELTHAAHDASGGNPFLLSELLSTLAAEGPGGDGALAQRIRKVGPPKVARSVLQRLARVSENAVALAQAMAVLGRSVEFHHAATLAGLSEPCALDAVDKLVCARILAPGRPLEFRHPLLRTAVYADMSAPRRAREHKRAARLLAETGGGSDAVAGQLLLSEPTGDGWVVAKLREAAAASSARAAPEPVVEYLTRCMAEPPTPAERPAILLALGSARFHSGDAEGIEVLREAFELAADPRQRALIALELSSLLYYFGKVPEAVSLLDGALSGLEPDHPLAAPLEATLLAIAGLGSTTHELLDERLDPAVELLSGSTPTERLMLAVLALRVGSRAGPAAKAVSIAERALAAGKLFEEQPAYAVGLMFPICALLFADEFDATAKALEDLFAQAQTRGSLLAFSIASWARGWLNHRIGALADAETDLRISISAGLEGGWQDASAFGTGLLIEVLVGRGEIVQAEGVLRVIDEGFHAASTTVSNLFLLEGRSRLRLAQGQTRGALEDLLELGRRCEEFGWQNPAHHRWRSDAALALAELGRPGEAHRLAHEELELARGFGAPRAIAIALRACALLARDGQAIAWLQEAAAVIDDSGAALVKAAVLLDLGAALRRANQRTAAREPLVKAVALAERGGACPLAARARVELEATGARARRLLAIGAAALTPSERRVCELVAEGRSNPEVAQLLFVTRGTVEAHLRAAYRKLDISSRKELTRALAAG
jgi:DNA-binding CsgD family transcriptional regulator